MKRYDNYKFRASQLGHIMGGIPKSLTTKQEQMYNDYTTRKNGEGRKLTDNQLATWGKLHLQKLAKPTLSGGAKTYLENLVWEDVMGRSKKVSNHYTQKGIEVEEKSITLYSEVRNKLFLKNKERKENDFFTGEADNIQGKIRDIKSSFEFATFPAGETEIKNTLYKWQLDVYMELWGLKEAELIYCLVDTPNRLVEGEIRKLDYRHNLLNIEGDLREEHIPLVVETVCNLIYTEKSLEEFCSYSSNVHIEWFKDYFKEIPKELRVKVFEWHYSHERIGQALEMVCMARNYMNKVLDHLGGTVLNNTNHNLLETA